LETTPANPPATILVIDDNEANRLLAQATLEDEGYRVLVASSGAQGLAAFEAERPACVLLDIRMPGLDGFEVCARLRALPGGGETPILFVTAQRDVDTFDQALRAGGDDFLTKPVRPAELVVRVQTAIKLRQTQAELREHYGLLRRQRDDLLRVQLQKERLTAFIVHDLKNPVNSMDLYAQLLLRDRSLGDSARDAAAQIRSEAKVLNRMILNLLDLSKADEGKLTARRSPVSLGALARSILVELEPSAQHREVNLQTALQVDEVLGDEDLLRRLLANLVENAIRHAPPRSSVTLGGAVVPGAVELRVIDEGPGVPVAMRESIFDAFVQVQEKDRVAPREGRGLGLAFCKMVAVAHGGQIWVEEGAPGAIFCVRLPDPS